MKTPSVRELLDRVLGKSQTHVDVTAGAGDLPIKAFANVDLDRVWVAENPAAS